MTTGNAAAGIVLWAVTGAVGIALAWRAGAWGAARAGLPIGSPPVWLPLVGAVCAATLSGHPALVALALVAFTAAAIDLRCGLIPDALIAPALVLLIAVRHVELADTIAGAFACCALLAIPWAVSRGRGFGLGDVKFGLVIGAALGPFAGMCAIGTAFVCGGVVGAGLLCARVASRQSALPFAPFLAAGAALVAVTMK
jgi:prepilin signal peptidase PulO-like enzyme (type II secretory pathway)